MSESASSAYSACKAQTVLQCHRLGMSLRNSCGMLQANAWPLMAAKISKHAAEMCMEKTIRRVLLQVCSEKSSWKLIWLGSELHSDSTPSSWVALQLQCVRDRHHTSCNRFSTHLPTFAKSIPHCPSGR